MMFLRFMEIPSWHLEIMHMVHEIFEIFHRLICWHNCNYKCHNRAVFIFTDIYQIQYTTWMLKVWTVSSTTLCAHVSIIITDQTNISENLYISLGTGSVQYHFFIVN